MDKDADGREFATGEEGRHPADKSKQDTNPNGDHDPRPAHQRLVFTDPAAFRYLEEDPSTTVLERRRRLKGYELYIVEQWACSRIHPTFVITTYSGLEHHSVVVGVLSVPTDEKAWSPRLRVYLKAITKYHARKKDTWLGTLMVTNLSGFPSALTVIAVPDGDLRKHREDFVVNENLKRLGCSGRAGLNLSPPIGATQAKFSQLYHTSDQIPVSNAAVELVKLCQVALMLFGKLAPQYADGLLCDITEQAINDWWTELGTEFFNVDPSDGILGPTTVAALLGILMGARNRLNAFGAPVAKDVFDIASTKRGVAYFQKSQKMERNRRLDRQTLVNLHKATAKAASGEGWTVPRAVKSTVAELSGKGGEMVTGREKSGIAEVETLDIETFIQLGSGERFKWLWYGKPRKNNDSGAFNNLGGDDGLVFSDNERGGYSWSGKKRDSVDDDPSMLHALSDRLYLHPTHGSQMSIDPQEKDQVLRKAALKNVTGKVADARSGLGRIKDAVGRRGLRGHQQRYSKDGNLTGDEASLREKQPKDSVELTQTFDIMSDVSQLEKSPMVSAEQSTVGSKESSRRGSQGPVEEKGSNGNISRSLYSSRVNEAQDHSSSSLEAPAIRRESRGPRSDYMDLIKNANGITARHREHDTADNSRNGSLTVSDTQAIVRMEHFDWASSKLPTVRTRRSLSQLDTKSIKGHWERRWPRHLSFTAMVDVLAASVDNGLTEADGIVTKKDPDKALALEESLMIEGRVMEERLQHLKTLETSWVEAKVAQIELYDQQCGRDQSKLDMVYHQKLEENHALQDASDDLLAEERTSLTETIKDVEVLGAKLEYELSALQSKVEDVENGVAEFERQVSQIEARAQELDEDREMKVTWMRWLLGRFSLGLF